MCGILAALGLTGDKAANRQMMLRQSKLLRHRGPDATGLWQSEKGDSAIAFERLTIVDQSEAGGQPFVLTTTQGTLVWALNSEIYNHMALREQYLKGVPLVKDSHSDSAVVGHLYQVLGDDDALWNALDGIFACCVVDEAAGTFTVARDPIGVCSLYWGRTPAGALMFASEMKALQGVCETFDIFPPGHCYRSRTGRCERYYHPVWRAPGRVPGGSADLGALRGALEASVRKRLMADAPLGVLLSGGLDSSLVASIAARHVKGLHTFSIGLAGSPDLLAARRVADFLGTTHHECHFTVQEGLDALSDLVYHIESYEQVRAAVPMYLLSRKIKAQGFKVVLSGEGADEIFGGYLYFHKAPSASEFHRETVRKIERLHQWDVCRANKAPFAFGLETRVPFLDREFIDVSMAVDPAHKMIDMADRPDGCHAKLEKYVLRKAFDTPARPYLPEDVLWRQKEQFSDGVGYSWVDGLKAHAAALVSDAAWAARAERFPEHTPTTREYYLLRDIFQGHFPSRCALGTVPQGLSIACSTPEAVAWDPAWAGTHEISGRAMASVHEAGTGFGGPEQPEAGSALAAPPSLASSPHLAQRRSCPCAEEAARPAKLARHVSATLPGLRAGLESCAAIRPWLSLECLEDAAFALPSQQDIKAAMVRV